MNIESKLTELRLAREELAKSKAAATSIMDNFKATNNEYAHATQNAQAWAIEVDALEAQIKELAVAEYNTTGNKKPHEKVAIKIFKTFKILDAETVRKWAFDNLPAALKLDEKKVEKYATEFGDVAGTEKGEEPRAQIASEL